jgi:hypothetical protein
LNVQRVPVEDVNIITSPKMSLRSLTSDMKLQFYAGLPLFVAKSRMRSGHVELDSRTSMEDQGRKRHFYISVLCLCLVSVITSLDSVIMAVILSKVAEDLHANTTESFWCGTGFLLAQTVGDNPSPIYCQHSDRAYVSAGHYTAIWQSG